MASILSVFTVDRKRVYDTCQARRRIQIVSRVNININISINIKMQSGEISLTT